jgi:surface antigen
MISDFKGWSNLIKMLTLFAICIGFAFALPSCTEEGKGILTPFEEPQQLASSGDISLDHTTDPFLPDVGSTTVTMRTPGVYLSQPSVGGTVPNSSSSVIITGTCGSHDGGVLSAKVQSQSGSTFVIRISKQGGSVFASSGTGYIKSGSLCGSILGTQAYAVGVPYFDITVTVPYFEGILHLYPMVISGGFRYYAEPVLVYTSPMNNSSWTYGSTLGTVNGVAVKCNAATSNQSTTGTYQCTEFCARYYQTVYGRNFTHYLAAKLWYGDYTNLGDLERCSNGGSKAPRPGDILCMTNSGNGHVAIIIRVESSYVLIAHQNSGTSWTPIGAQLSRSGNTISNPSGYTIQGWLRMPQY